MNKAPDHVTEIVEFSTRLIKLASVFQELKPQLEEAGFKSPDTALRWFCAVRYAEDMRENLSIRDLAEQLEDGLPALPKTFIANAENLLNEYVNFSNSKIAEETFQELLTDIKNSFSI